MKITNKITVHMDDRHIVPWVDAVQCDANTRVLELTLLEGGEAWAVPSGMVVSVAFRKSDGTAGWYDRLPDGSGACAYSGNVVTAVLAPQVLTAWGKTEVAVVIQDPDTLDQIAVFPIRVEVARNPAAGKGISNDHYDYKTLADVNEVLAGIDRCIRPYAWTVKTADLAQSGWATFLDLPTDRFYRCSSDLAASFGLPVVGAPCTLVVFDPSNEKTGAYWHRMYICTVRRDMGEETYLAYVAPETAAADVVWRKVATGDVNDKVDNLGTYLCFYPVVLNIDTAADTITLNPGYLYTRGGQKIRIAEKVTVPRAVDGMSMLVYDTRDAAVKSIDAAKLESSHVVIAILSGLEHVGHPNANFVPGRWSVDWVVVPDGKRTDSVLCVGDSIARGDSNGKKGFVGELGLPYRNAAVSGATISNVRTDRQNVADQLLAVEGYHPGIVIAQGGINDYFRNAPLGTVPTAKAASAEGLDRGTVLGALEYLFCQMEQRYPQAERYFLLGHRTANGGKDLSVTANAAGYTMTQMYDAFREVCRLYGVGVIDVFGKSPIDTADPMYVSPVAYAQDASVGERYFVDADGIHPLAFGYRHGYVPIVRAALGIGEDVPVDLNVVIDTIRAYAQYNGLDPEAVGLADGSVTPNKTSFLKQYTQNLYDRSKSVPGALNGDGTVDTGSTEFIVSDFIPVEKAVYVINSKPWYICLYKDGVGVERFTPSGYTIDLTEKTFEFDSLRMAHHSFISETLMFSKDELPTDYVAYDSPENVKTEIVDGSVERAMDESAYAHIREQGVTGLLQDHTIPAVKLDFAEDRQLNLLDASKLSDGYVNSDGKIIVSGSVKLSDFIPVKEGKTYYGLGTWNSGLYDENKKFIRTFGSSDMVGRSYTVPVGEGIAYIRSAGVSDTSVIAEGFRPHFWVPFTKSFRLLDDYARADVKAYLSGTFGKRWYAVGDSITQGTGAPEGNYVDMVCRGWMYGGVNHGAAGTKLTSVAGDGTGMCERIKTYDETQCDIITIAGGTNDRSGVIGTMEDTDTTTVYGALKDICNTLLTKYAGRPCGFITPLNYTGGTEREVTKAIKEVAAYYGIPVLDMEKECPALCINDEMKAIYCPDGLHPSTEGHKIMARKIGAWMQTL